MWQITEIIKECCTCDPYKTPTFWVVHNLKKSPEHFSKYCNSQYIQACLRWPQECSLKNKEKKKSHWNYLISSKPLSKKSNITVKSTLSEKRWNNFSINNHANCSDFNTKYILISCFTIILTKKKSPPPPPNKLFP